jgi:hypothetical protein
LDITAFIRELLFGHDCVIVPGFGGFIGNYTPATIDKSTGTFHPPVKLISFNRNLNHNDGLLIKRISAERGLNYGDARTMVEEFVAGIRKRLDKGEKIVFDKIGTFVNNEEGNVQFEPDRTVNYHLDSFGLESFQCLPLEDYDVRKRITGRQAKDYSTLRRYLWRAAVIIPVAGILFAVSLKTDLFRTKIEATSMNPLVTAEFESNKAASDLISDTSGVVNTAENIPAPAVTEETSAKPLNETTSTVPAEANVPADVTSAGSYFIITGSFQSEENAGKQVTMLQAAGFNPEVVKAGNGFYRVCAMACPDLNTAIARKDSIIDKFPGSWISRKK